MLSSFFMRFFLQIAATMSHILTGSGSAYTDDHGGEAKVEGNFNAKGNINEDHLGRISNNVRTLLQNYKSVHKVLGAVHLQFPLSTQLTVNWFTIILVYLLAVFIAGSTIY